MMQIDDLAALVNRLRGLCLDGEATSQAAARAVTNRTARTRLEHHGAQLERLARELGVWLDRFGASAAAVPAHGGMTDFRECDENALLAGCELQEWNTREAFAEALREDLPLNIRMVVQRQYSEIKAMHEALRRLEIALHAH